MPRSNANNRPNSVLQIIRYHEQALLHKFVETYYPATAFTTPLLNTIKSLAAKIGSGFPPRGRTFSAGEKGIWPFIHAASLGIWNTEFAKTYEPPASRASVCVIFTKLGEQQSVWTFTPEVFVFTPTTEWIGNIAR